MTTKEDLRIKAKSLLLLGDTPKVVAEKTGIQYHIALILSKEIASEKLDNKVHELKAIDPTAIEILIDKARDEAPAMVIKKLETVQEGLSSLQMLDIEFHSTMSLVLKRANKYLENESLRASEWATITNALSSAYNNIFNNNGVNVHVDNSTKVSSTNLSMMKGAMRE